MKKWKEFIFLASMMLLPGSAFAVIHQLTISGFDFVPVGITISQGDSVRWTNNDLVTHTSTSDNGVWNSGSLTNGQSFTFGFTSPGTFPYHCTPHPTMRDTITVTPAATFDVQVNMQDNFFDPRVIQIEPGQTVRWVNQGIHNHTSTSDDGLWDSGFLTPGQFFDFTFGNEGVYDYTCQVHFLTMFGTVVVGRPDSVVQDINMANFQFAPSEVSVIMGQYVRWINFDDAIHTSTDTSVNYWDSGDIGPGDVFTLHADMAGDFHYVCIPHMNMGMAGTLHVVDTTSGGGCSYVPGDVNGNGTTNGLDVGYFVNYLKGGAQPPIACDCPPHGLLFAGADANGNCAVNGLDVSYLVNYFMGGAPILHCMDCMPAR